MNEQRNFEKPSPEDEKKKYILRKRQEWEDNKEIREFFYQPLTFPIKEDHGNKET